MPFQSLASEILLLIENNLSFGKVFCFLAWHRSSRINYCLPLVLGPWRYQSGGKAPALKSNLYFCFIYKEEARFKAWSERSFFLMSQVSQHAYYTLGNGAYYEVGNREHRGILSPRGLDNKGLKLCFHRVALFILFFIILRHLFDRSLQLILPCLVLWE